MRTNYLLLGLITVTMVVGLYMANSPQQAENLAENPLHADVVNELHQSLDAYRSK